MSSQVVNIHDAFFKQVLSDQQAAGTFLREGLAEARAKGLVEGRAEGEAIALVRLLEKRFGVLPTPLRQRVFSADLGSIEAWFGQAIDGPDLESVFKSP